MEGVVPVYRPTWEEFQHFNLFIKSKESEGQRYGVCKVVPPPEAQCILDTLDYDTLTSEVPIKYPIKQVVEGVRLNAFRVTNFIEHPNIKVKNFESILDQMAFPPIDLSTLRNPGREVDPSLMDENDRRCCDYFKPEALQTLEKLFWVTLGEGDNAPLYGADTPGTLFDDLQIPWNLNDLGTQLNVLGDSIPGVTTPYLYFGTWRAMFPWHTEDMELYSINFVHYGAPKQWYVIPPGFAERFQEVCREKYFPKEAKQCSEFLRHKAFLIDPDALMQEHLIPVYKITQYEREFIIVWASAYHAGFNYGMNCAESVNFATDQWAKTAENAKHCKCQSNSVNIDLEFYKSCCSQIFLAQEVNDFISRGQEPGLFVKPSKKNKKKSKKKSSDDLGQVPGEVPFMIKQEGEIDTKKACRKRKSSISGETLTAEGMVAQGSLPQGEVKRKRGRPRKHPLPVPPPEIPPTQAPAAHFLQAPPASQPFEGSQHLLQHDPFQLEQHQTQPLYQLSQPAALCSPELLGESRIGYMPTFTSDVAEMIDSDFVSQRGFAEPLSFEGHSQQPSEMENNILKVLGTFDMTKSIAEKDLFEQMAFQESNVSSADAMFRSSR